MSDALETSPLSVRNSRAHASGNSSKRMRRANGRRHARGDHRTATPLDSGHESGASSSGGNGGGANAPGGAAVDDLVDEELLSFANSERLLPKSGAVSGGGGGEGGGDGTHVRKKQKRQESAADDTRITLEEQEDYDEDDAQNSRHARTKRLLAQSSERVNAQTLRTSLAVRNRNAKRTETGKHRREHQREHQREQQREQPREQPRHSMARYGGGGGGRSDASEDDDAVALAGAVDYDDGADDADGSDVDDDGGDEPSISGEINGGDRNECMLREAITKAKLLARITQLQGRGVVATRDYDYTANEAELTIEVARMEVLAMRSARLKQGRAAFMTTVRGAEALANWSDRAGKLPRFCLKGFSLETQRDIGIYDDFLDAGVQQVCGSSMREMPWYAGLLATLVPAMITYSITHRAADDQEYVREMINNDPQLRREVIQEIAERHGELVIQRDRETDAQYQQELPPQTLPRTLPQTLPQTQAPAFSASAPLPHRRMAPPPPTMQRPAAGAAGGGN